MCMTRLPLAGLLLGSAVLLALASLDYFFSRDAPGARVDGPAPSLANVTAGQSVPVIFTVHNPTRHQVRIVGLVEC
jgi:uncharacterized protein (DUF58 family)